mmetsp:Transcript_25363/g.70554  ORF Transcript_25363/g.70554 Transcript_25363/m.70554 type:complete len:239 (+) Transcript_25363:1083-1799(+)
MTLVAQATRPTFSANQSRTQNCSGSGANWGRRGSPGSCRRRCPLDAAKPLASSAFVWRWAKASAPDPRLCVRTAARGLRRNAATQDSTHVGDLAFRGRSPHGPAVRDMATHDRMELPEALAKKCRRRAPAARLPAEQRGGFPASFGQRWAPWLLGLRVPRHPPWPGLALWPSHKSPVAAQRCPSKRWPALRPRRGPSEAPLQTKGCDAATSPRLVPCCQATGSQSRAAAWSSKGFGRY